MIDIKKYRKDRFNSAKIYILQSLFYFDETLLPFLEKGGEIKQNGVKITLHKPTYDINIISFEYDGYYDLVCLYELVGEYHSLQNYMLLFYNTDKLLIDNMELLSQITLEGMRIKSKKYTEARKLEMITVSVEPTNKDFNLQEVINKLVELVNSNNISPFMFMLKSDNYKTKVLTQLNSQIYNDEFLRVMLQLNNIKDGILEIHK